MQIPVNKDLDSYTDDFFKGLTMKQTLLSVISVAAGTLTYLFGTYVCHLPQTACFYLALPVVLPIASSGFLRIRGMTPGQYLSRRHNALASGLWVFVPEVLLPLAKEEKTPERKRILMLDAAEEEVIGHGS